MQPSTEVGTLLPRRHRRLGRTAGVVGLLLNLGSLALILPGCGLAAVMLSVYVLTTVSWGVVLWDMLVALAWLPVILGVALGALLCFLVLLIRFPLLLPMLLAAAGLGSVGILCATAGVWSENGETGGWLVIALGVLGTALAAVQITRTRRLAGA